MQLGHGATKANVGDQFVSWIWKGFTYNIANSSRVITEDLAIHPLDTWGCMRWTDQWARVPPLFIMGTIRFRQPHLCCTGAHKGLYMQVPRNGRIISSNADGLHSEDLDAGPTIVDSRFESMLDDF